MADIKNLSVYAALALPHVPVRTKLETPKNHKHVWRRATRQQRITWCCLKSRICVAKVQVTCECGAGYCAAHSPRRAREVLPPNMKGSPR